VYNPAVKDPRAPFPEIIKLNAYWFGLSFMWNGLHQLILPAVLLNFVDYQKKNTTLGLLTFTGLLIAAIIQPVSGALSDRWSSTWGRRRPLILLGTMSDFIFLSILAWAGGLLWIAVGYIGLQITSNVAHGPAQGLLPDRVPPPQRGLASGIKNLMDMAGLMTAMLILGRVLDPEAGHLIPSMAIIAAFLACGAAVTLIGIREQPSNTPTSRDDTQNGVKISPDSRRSKTSYTWLIASRFIFLFGIYGVQGFIQYYIRDVMRVVNPVKLTADLLAMIILALMIFALGGGFLGDRIGHKRVLYLASVIGSVGSLLLIGARTPTTLLVYGCVFGAGLGLFLTSNWALANILAPSEQAGKYLGLSNLATAGAGAVARLTGPVIDVLNNARDGLYFGYTFLFILGALAMLTSLILLRRVEECWVIE
jgi:MFS family permease